MKRLTALLSALALLLAGQPVTAAVQPVRSERWRATAVRALTAFTAAEGSAETAHAYAFAAHTHALLDGWDSPKVTAYLTKLYATANPDGGYGLGYAYDAFQDGTINPATTTYSITLSQHVGPALLDGWRAGVVPAVRVQRVIDLLVAMPRLDTAAGRCLAYSTHANDAKAGMCVHNANIAAAHFFQQAADAGFPGVWWLMAGITKRELSAYDATARWWNYRDAPAQWQDFDHNSFSAEAAYDLAYPVGYAVAYKMMSAAGDGKPQSPVAHMRLTGLPAVPSAMSTADPTTTIWCVLGDQWLAEADGFVTTEIRNARRLGQAAYYSARNARACQ